MLSFEQADLLKNYLPVICQGAINIERKTGVQSKYL